MKNFYQKGITVVELIVVLAVLGIIISVVIPQFSKMRESAVLKTAVNDILSSINKAKSETLSSLNSSSYGVHFQSDGVIIFKGVSFVSNDPNNENISITTPASISNGTLILPANIYFNRLSGTPSTTGTVIVSTTSYSKTITISATGVASTN